jgi:hypothetical protein
MKDLWGLFFFIFGNPHKIHPDLILIQTINIKLIIYGIFWKKVFFFFFFFLFLYLKLVGLKKQYLDIQNNPKTDMILGSKKSIGLDYFIMKNGENLSFREKFFSFFFGFYSYL